jgi:two-component system, NtrC family, sensor histidine kinase HydH
MGKGRRVVLTRVSVAVASMMAATLLHYLTPPSAFLWHNLFQRLYYLPIVYAAVYFGWRGGLLVSGCSTLCYIPHIVLAWRHLPEYAVNQYAEIIVFVLVGAVTGVLSDKERKQRRELYASTTQLARVYGQLHESFEHLKRADRLSAIGELAAGLAHEIRNPLASIEGAASVLERPETSEDIRTELFGIIQKECRRLTRLLTHLLEFARPRTPQLRVVDLEHVIDSIVLLLTHTAQRSRVTMRKTIPARVPPLECDPDQLKQVILNLTLNAIQAMPGGGEVEMLLTSAASHVVIAVKDQGPGVDSQNLDRIFDPFFTTKAGGTGLGLSVAHRIVTQHGGTITAENNPAGGITFSVHLPLRAGPPR